MYTGCAKRTIGQGRAGAASWASCLLSKSCQEARSEAEMLALTYELPPYRSSSTITFHAHPVFWRAFASQIALKHANEGEFER